MDYDSCSLLLRSDYCGSAFLLALYSKRFTGRCCWTGLIDVSVPCYLSVTIPYFCAKVYAVCELRRFLMPLLTSIFLWSLDDDRFPTSLVSFPLDFISSIFFPICCVKLGAVEYICYCTVIDSLVISSLCYGYFINVVLNYDFMAYSFSFFVLDCTRPGSLSVSYEGFFAKLGLLSIFLLLVLSSNNCLLSVMISLTLIWLFSTIFLISMRCLLELRLWNSNGFFYLLIWITRCILGSLFIYYVILLCFYSI